MKKTVQFLVKMDIDADSVTEEVRSLLEQLLNRISPGCATVSELDPSFDELAILTIHQKIGYWTQGNESPMPSHYRCKECNQYWPCNTVEAIVN